MYGRDISRPYDEDHWNALIALFEPCLSYESYILLISGSWLAAGLNMLASIGLGLLGISLGVGMARLLG